MNRREFLTLVGGAAATWPLAARAQQPKTPVVGFLNGGSPDGYAPYVTGFLHGLNETGYVEGKNVTVDYRWARGQYDRLQAMAADLVRRKVAVIAANTPTAPVAKAATTEIPIVFVSTGDPVMLGLVTSFNRPGGNVTGVGLLGSELETKRLELEIKHDELRNQRQRRPRVAVSPVWIPLLAAGFALFGSIGTTMVTARDRAQAEAIEEKKFEMALVQEAVKGNDTRKTAQRLLFAARAGYIHLNKEQEQTLTSVARGERSLSDVALAISQPKAPAGREQHAPGERK